MILTRLVVCGAIEMAGCITIKFNVIKNGMAEMAMKSPFYIPGAVEPQFGPSRHIHFEGFSVDSTGKQHYLDATVAYKQTLLRCFEYLRRFGKRRHSSLATRLIAELHRIRRLSDSHSPLMRPSARTHCWNRRCKLSPKLHVLTLILRHQTRVPPWAYQWISSTSISVREQMLSGGIWGLVRWHLTPTEKSMISLELSPKDNLSRQHVTFVFNLSVECQFNGSRK
jgi:hypothetical protein